MVILSKVALIIISTMITRLISIIRVILITNSHWHFRTASRYCQCWHTAYYRHGISYKVTETGATKGCCDDLENEGVPGVHWSGTFLSQVCPTSSFIYRFSEMEFLTLV
jgi:hypothetical protein